MKTFIALLTLVFSSFAFVVSVQAQEQEIIKFEKTTHDFGTLKQEDGDAEYTFKFTNTTNKPIKLTYVRASCGCTTPTWTKDVIQPNETGEVTAKYGASTRPGSFTKSITVRAASVSPNGEIDSTTTTNKVLMIKGDVKPKAVEEKAPTSSEGH